MGETTPKLGLYKPVIATDTFGQMIGGERGNWDTLDDLAARPNSYTSGVAGFTPNSIKDALDALATMVSGGPTTVPAVKVRHSVDQSAASGVATALAFDTELFDTDSMHDPVANNSRLTIRTPGRYLVVGLVSFQPNNVGTRTVFIRKNGLGTLGHVTVHSVSSARPIRIQITALELFSANDYVELVVYQDSGSSLSIPTEGGVFPWFAAVRVGN